MKTTLIHIENLLCCNGVLQSILEHGLSEVAILTVMQNLIMIRSQIMVRSTRIHTRRARWLLGNALNIRDSRFEVIKTPCLNLALRIAAFYQHSVEG